MTERRPNWEDDLIESVQRILDREWSRPEGPHEKAFDLIAAVEDWHRDRWTGVCESPEEVVLELKQAQAAIQRVREQPCTSRWKYECECCTRIWIALEGGSDE